MTTNKTIFDKLVKEIFGEIYFLERKKLVDEMYNALLTCIYHPDGKLTKYHGDIGNTSFIPLWNVEHEEALAVTYLFNKFGFNVLYNKSMECYVIYFKD